MSLRIQVSLKLLSQIIEKFYYLRSYTYLSGSNRPEERHQGLRIRLATCLFHVTDILLIFSHLEPPLQLEQGIAKLFLES